MSKESADQFGQLGALYEDLATWPFREHIETPSVKSALGPLAGLDVVDYGCGSGFYARTMKAEGARRVVGYDLADGMLDYARRVAERDGVPIEFRSRLGPECEGTFDVVLAVYVLPYATTRAELEQMCAEMMAPLRPGGRLVALPIHSRFESDPGYYAACGFTLTPDDPQRPYEEGAPASGSTVPPVRRKRVCLVLVRGRHRCGAPQVRRHRHSMDQSDARRAL